MFSHTAEYALRAVVWLASQDRERSRAPAARTPAGDGGTGHATVAGAAAPGARPDPAALAAPASSPASPASSPAAAAPEPTAATPHWPQTTQEIARATGVPAGYLSKVLQALVKAGVVESQRGLHGGFRLALAPERLSILDVITAVHPIRRYLECPAGNPAHGRNLCPLHAQLERATATVEASLAQCSIAELTHGAGQTPVCQLLSRPRQGVVGQS